jgi:hypothetical protein|tara:strand:+ start:120 stop:368 length:249 start_codon:yes stop_codon:yes gene_type:complete
MPKNNFHIFKKQARLSKTKEKYIDVLLAMNVLPNVNEPMARMTLEAYWVYYTELTDSERRMRDVSRFVHGYVSKNIQDKLFS